jgi:uncharacterized protein DUF6559
LLSRFEKKRYYTIEEVAHTCQVAGLPTAFLAYAHAMFCNRSEFDDYYVPLRVACTYDGLRRQVSRRFFDGNIEFDAEGIIVYVVNATDKGGLEEFRQGPFYGR